MTITIIIINIIIYKTN